MKKVLTLGVVLSTLLWTMGVSAFVPVASAATLAAGDLIKASGPAVYYYAADGQRYTFPTQSTYMTWFTDFSAVKTITDDELAAIDLNGNVVVRPGTKLVKINTVPKVFAVEPDGKLLWVNSETAAKTLYGSSWASRIIDIPDGFWVNYTATGATLDGTKYPTGQLIKYASSADIYIVNSDGTKSMLTSNGFTANNFNFAFVVTAPDSITMSTGTEIAAVVDALVDVSQGGGAGSGTTPTTGSLAVSLNGATPAAGYVSKGAQNALFAKFNFASSNEVTVSKIVLQRKGLGYDADIDTVRLYEGATQVGTDQSLNTTTHKVTFTNLNWKVLGTKTLDVKVNVAAAPAGTNDYFEVVEVVTGGTVSGLPVAGNAMQFSALTVGQLDVDAQSSGSTVSVISGATDQEFGCWNFTTSATEGFYVESIKLTNIGSASSTDAKNFKLKVGSTVLTGTEVAAMAADSTVTFSLTPNYFIDKSTVKKICVYGDVTAGITVTKTLRFQIAETKNVVARGDSSAGAGLITYAGGTAFVSQSAKTNSIGQGSATLAQDAAYAPTDGAAFVKGVPANKMAAYKVSAGATEGVRLTKLTVVLSGTNVANTDFTNWALYKIVDGAEVLIPVSGSVSGLNVTFEDTTNGLLDVPKSENKSFVVKADVSTSAAGNESVIKIAVGANGTTNTLARIKGLESGDYITDGVTLSGVAVGNAQQFTIGASGSLTVSKAAASPAAATVAKGTSNVLFTTINLYATGEDINVTDLVITGTKNGPAVVATGDLSNVKLMDEAGNQLGTTVTNPASGEFSFSFSYTVPKELNKTIKVYGDVPSGSTATSIHVDMDTANTDITSTGAYSSATIAEAGTAVGSTMTIGTPSLNAIMGASPITTSHVTNSTGVTVGTLVLSASTTEDIKVTSIKISADDAAGIAGASTASANFSNFKLLDNVTGTQFGSTLNLTDAVPDYVTFSGLTGLTITKGQSKTLKLVADVNGTTAGPWYFGLLSHASTTAVGLQSNAAADITGTEPSASAAVSIASVGTLKINKAADMPAAAQLVSSSTGNTVMKYKLESAYENVDITILPIYYTGTVADVANFKLYKDGVLIGDANGYTMTGALTAVNFSAGTFVVTKDVPTYLTIKMDLNAKAQVTTSAASVYLGIADSNSDNSEWGGAGNYNVEAKGVASGATLNVANIDSIGDGNGNVFGSNNFTLHKGILTISKSAVSPSGTVSTSTSAEVLRLDLLATGDEITVNQMDIIKGGTCNPTGTAAAYIKSSDGGTTYETFTAGTAWLDQSNTVAAFDSALVITAGETKTIKFMGDTTGCTVNETLQFSIDDGTNTLLGVDYADSSAVAIDLITTKNLPVAGGTLSY